MKYLFLIRVDPDTEATDAEANPVPWITEMDERGARIVGNRLRPASEAKVVRIRRGEVLATEGPFTEAKELIGGFDLIECADDAEAIEIASKHPVARFGAVEVRRFWPFDAAA
jgi:hypothetical protein